MKASKINVFWFIKIQIIGFNRKQIAFILFTSHPLKDNKSNTLDIYKHTNIQKKEANTYTPNNIEDKKQTTNW